MKLAPRVSPVARYLLLWMLCAATSGCSAPRRLCLPPGLLASAASVDLNSTSNQHATADRDILEASLARLKSASDGEAVGSMRQYNVLALSGGGSFGAFTAGVLGGWTATGRRPVLDMVTGVSTGALIATYAFLGPEYDRLTGEMYTTISSNDIYRSRPKLAVLWSDSAATSEPLQRMIESRISPQLLQAVANAHARGRRLYVGTTNLDTGKLVIWDMGAIASSGQCKAIDLYRKIILASASVPGFLPPVSIDVTVNGRQYTELHADGGATAQVFFRASMLSLDTSQFTGGRRPFVGSHMYIIVAGKAFPDPECVEPRAVQIASTALSSLTYAQTRNDLIRIYTLTLLTGMDFHVATIPQDFPISRDSMAFEPAEMQRLYQQGFQLAAGNRVWADVPPVLDASQESIPRSGVDFVVPDEAVIRTGSTPES